MSRFRIRFMGAMSALGIAWRNAGWLDKRALLPAWLGIVVLGFAWLQALYVYTAPVHNAWVWFAVGTALLIIGVRGGDPGPRRVGLGGIPLLVASIAGIAFLPRPQEYGLWALGAAVIVWAIPVRRLHTALVPGLWTAGLVLVLQAAVLPALVALGAHWHEMPWAAPFLRWSLLPFAPGTVRTGSVLHLLGDSDSVTLTPSWEQWGLIPAGLVAVGFVALALLHRRGAHRLPALFVLGAGYLWVRLVFSYLLVARFRAAQIFWDREYLFLGFLPLAAIVALWWRHGRSAVADEVPATTGGWRRVVAATALAIAGWTFFAGWHDPGVRKQGRVLIDESHSDWEWTTDVFDTVWYGGRSGYNYYCLADYWSHFYQVETRREPLTPALLANYDVLVLKTPTSAFAPAEVDAIVTWVRAGGGLFLIGDHTNVFGSSTYLNPIADRFGMYFRYDATYTLDYLALSLYVPPRTLPHPVVRNVPLFLFATSCSLDSPLLSENVILGYGLRSMYLDYSETSYFPTKVDKFDYLYPLLVQLGGVRAGKGRVLGFTDSTTFSNFFMFVPGKPELALGCIEWLNRTNRAGVLRWLFLAAGLLGTILVAAELRRGPRASRFDAMLAAGVLTFVLVARLCDRASASAYPLPQAQRPMAEVVFDGEHGTLLLPTTELVADHWANLHTFYVWTQRLGLVPRVAPRLRDGLVKPGRALLSVNPNHEFELDDVDGVVDFVRRGGTLFVFDTPENRMSTANQILGPFAMGFMPQPVDSVTIVRADNPEADLLSSAAGDTVATARQAYTVTGCRPLLQTAAGATVLGVRDFGRGKVVAFGASRLFSTESMGNTAVMPNAAMQRLYRLEYDLFERIAGIRVTERYAQTAGASKPAPAAP